MSPTPFTKKTTRSCVVREIGRFLAPLGVMLLVWTAPVTASNPAEAAPAEGAQPLTLTNEHVDMTREEIESSQAAAATGSAPAPAPAPTPAVDADAGADADPQAQADALAKAAEVAQQKARDAAERAETARLALEAVEAGLVPGVGPNQDGPATFEHCIEASIRRGQSYAESNRLCGAVFGAPDS